MAQKDDQHIFMLVDNSLGTLNDRLIKFYQDKLKNFNCLQVFRKIINTYRIMSEIANYFKQSANIENYKHLKIRY